LGNRRDAKPLAYNQTITVVEAYSLGHLCFRGRELAMAA